MTTPNPPISNDTAKLILSNCKSGARRYGNENRLTESDINEMQSWLVLQVTRELTRLPNYRNVAGIRHIISKRWVNWFDKQVVKRRKREKNMSYISQRAGTKDDLSCQEYIPEDADHSQWGSSIDPINDKIEHSDLYAFLETLSERERKVIELRAGFTDSLDTDELERLEEYLNKATCSCGDLDCHHSKKVYFTEAEIARILNITRRQVQYITSDGGDIRKRARTFGLKPL